MSGARFSIIPREAVTDRRLEGRDLQVLALLGGFTDNRGWCSRSQVKMARELGCGRSTVQRSLGRLIECGYVEQRPLVRADGGDRAHEYRVLLDDVRPGEYITEIDESEAFASPSSESAGTPETALSEAPPLPTGGQGVPTLAGQGVPSHGRAPIRTTLLKRDERETRAGRDPEAERQAAVAAAEADGSFMAWFATWPTRASDSIVRTHRAWLALSDDERAQATALSEGAVKYHTVTLRRTGCYAGFTYLEEKRWKRIATAAAAAGEGGGAPGITSVPAKSQTWFALLYRRWRAGERITLQYELGTQRGTAFAVKTAELPTPEDVAAMVKIETMRDGRPTAEMAAWSDEFGRAGISFTPQDLHLPFVWVPSRWPPGRAPQAEAARSETADVFGDGTGF